MRGVVPKGVTAPFGRNQGHHHAGHDREALGEPPAQNHRFAVVESVQRAGRKRRGHGGQFLQILALKPPHQGAERRAFVVHQHLAFDDRGGGGDAGNRADARRQRIVIGDGAGHALHDQMAVQPEDSPEQLGLEPVHHAHHDDEGGDAQRDADQREAGNHRNEALLALGAQIAPRHHPFETGEGPGEAGHVASFCGESLGIVLRNPIHNGNSAIWSPKCKEP